MKKFLIGLFFTSLVILQVFGIYLSVLAFSTTVQLQYFIHGLISNSGVAGR